VNDPFKQHGAFSWCELMTTDVEAAKRFYGSLFGWELEDKNLTGMPYSVATAGGAPIGGIMGKPPGMEAVPPHWGSYITVDDVDATAKQAEELGAQICLPPTDIPTVGRFCMLRDPQGASIAIIAYAKDCG
jgi:uncharacterized protein